MKNMLSLASDLLDEVSRVSSSRASHVVKSVRISYVNDGRKGRRLAIDADLRVRFVEPFNEQS